MLKIFELTCQNIIFLNSWILDIFAIIKKKIIQRNNKRLNKDNWLYCRCLIVYFYSLCVLVGLGRCKRKLKYVHCNPCQLLEDSEMQYWISYICRTNSPELCHQLVRCEPATDSGRCTVLNRQIYFRANQLLHIHFRHRVVMPIWP